MAKKQILFSESVIMDSIEDEELKFNLINLLEYHERNSPNTIISNVGGFQTPAIEDENINSIFLKKSAELLNENYNIKNTRLTLKRLWINRNFKYNINEPHTHSDCHFSGVYYLKTPKQGGALKFYRNDKAVEFLPNNFPIKDSKDFHNFVKIQPVENGLILFPSFMTHMVLPHYEEESRISVSFNIEVLPNG